MPCPSCSKPLGIDLNYIIQNPVCVCPYCEVIMNFNVNKELKREHKKVMKQINEIKESSIIKLN
jgi:hypothetical protein